MALLSTMNATSEAMQNAALRRALSARYSKASWTCTSQKKYLCTTAYQNPVGHYESPKKLFYVLVHVWSVLQYETARAHLNVAALDVQSSQAQEGALKPSRAGWHRQPALAVREFKPICSPAFPFDGMWDFFELQQQLKGSKQKLPDS